MKNIESEILRNNLNYTLFEWRKQSGYKPLNIDKGELTPTLKIRRKQINDNWKLIIDKMY